MTLRPASWPLVATGAAPDVPMAPVAAMGAAGASPMSFPSTLHTKTNDTCAESVCA